MSLALQQDLADLRRALASARGRQKIDLLLESVDPVAVVRAIPAEELYFALLEAGSDDAAEVIALASPEQFRTFLDLAVWPRSDEGPKSSEIIRWIRLSRAGAGREQGRHRKQLAGLDPELLASMLRHELTVHELTEDSSPDPENPGLAHYTPDRRFLLEFRSALDFEAVRQLIEDLYAQDPFLTGRMIESLRWEVPTELEESARRWRDARLRDLGVPELDEALAFFARPARTAPPAAHSVTAAQTGLVPRAATQPLLPQALALLSGEDLELAEESIVYASNASLVANRVQLSDADEVREQLLSARATLSLGLELLSGGDPASAARVLAERPVREIFQTAMGETYRLQTRARKLAQAARLPQAQSATLLDEPFESALQGMLAIRPKLHEPGKRWPRSFGSVADLRIGEKLLEEGEQLIALLHELGIPPEKLGPLAESAGVGPGVLKASSAISTLIESQLEEKPFTLALLLDETRARPPGYAERARELVPANLQFLLRLNS